MREIESITKTFFGNVEKIEKNKNLLLSNYEDHMFQYGLFMFDSGKASKGGKKLIEKIVEGENEIFDMNSAQFSLLHDYAKNLAKDKNWNNNLKEIIFDKAKQSMLTYRSSPLSDVTNMKLLEPYQGNSKINKLINQEKFSKENFESFESLDIKQNKVNLNKAELSKNDDFSQPIKNYSLANKIFPNSKNFNTKNANDMQKRIKDTVIATNKEDILDVDNLTHAIWFYEMEKKRSLKFNEVLSVKHFESEKSYIHNMNNNSILEEEVSSPTISRDANVQEIEKDSTPPIIVPPKLKSVKKLVAKWENFENAKQSEAQVDNDISKPDTNNSSPQASNLKTRPNMLKNKLSVMQNSEEYLNSQK